MNVRRAAVAAALLAAVCAQPATAHESLTDRQGGRLHVEITEQLPGAVATVLPGPVPGIFLRADSGRRITLVGSAGEPFARLSESGVEVNLKSPTWALTNRQRGGSSSVDVQPASEPSWTAQTSRPQLTWLEPRARSSAPGRVHEWSVPATVDGEPASLAGRTVWEPVTDRSAKAPAGRAIAAGALGIGLFVLALGLGRIRRPGSA